MSEVSDVIRHATMADFDNEIKSIVILMVAKGDPELHMAIHPDDVFSMNAATDMFKEQMMLLLKDRAEHRKKRE